MGPKQIDDDLYIIGAVCVFVCHKSHYFRTQRIWSFHTFIATFRTQRNWSFPCFLTLLYSKDLVVSMFLNTFRNQKGLYIYIMVKCMSVCFKSYYFCIQRIW